VIAPVSCTPVNSAFSVAGPTTPSGASCFAPWNCLARAPVFGPKAPSTTSFGRNGVDRLNAR
jgi:hypothetical protein